MIELQNVGFMYTVFFFITALFSFLINSIFLKFSKTLGVRNHVDDLVRWESGSKPALGGISFYILFLLSIIAYSIVFDHSQVLLNTKLLGLIMAVTLAFLMGLADDAYNTVPLLKISVQICCGIILIYTGTYITVSSSMPLNYLVTIVWIAGIMNAMNLIDNMDAISTIVSIFIILAAMIVIYLQQDITSIYFLLLIGVLSALLGFLYFNWHPSKMYMGDTGSQFLGVFLGIIGIVYFWNFYPQESVLTSTGGEGLQTISLLTTAKNATLALIVFVIPITDTTTVIINRIGRGTSPFIGGKDHTTHHLFYMGLSHKKIALLFMLISSFSPLFVYIINALIDTWTFFHFGLFIIYFLTIFGALFYTTRVPNSESSQEKLS